MLIVVRLFVLSLLGLVAAEDFRSRAVHWVLFPLLLFAFGALLVINHRDFYLASEPIVTNFYFLILVLGIVTAYFSWKAGRFVRLTETMIGWGDLFFFLTIACYLSVFNFLLFFIVSLLIVCIFWLPCNLFLKSKADDIPLAGCQAFLLLLFLAGDWFVLHFNATDDYWLLRYFIRCL